MSFDFNAYLNRIGIAKPEASLAGLSQLQQAQLGAIPFENINPLLGLVPELETAALMDKMVAKRRGGYCFELNGLFGQALDELGFAYQPIMARVRMGRNEGGPRLHLAFIVETEGDSWLVDAGFGGPSHYLPLRLNTEQAQSQDHNRFRLRQEPESGETVLERWQNGEWFALYSFDRSKVQRCDLEAANLVCTTWDQSLLSQNLLICRNTAEGWVQLFNTNFSKYRAGEQVSHSVASQTHLSDLLGEQFGIEINNEQLNRLAERLALSRGTQ
ncbi:MULTISPECIES: arylamine N-acetyltransferase family protein [Methylomonas]|uniref:N-hydroxyarylamine O-acetyltransferase n=2 Tax=Methylomonas TaxID=416 RepID=A0A140E3Q9_9GAMM|nr:MULTISPECIES: arylamine N-acetyltransferase [Methylomonas]AMK75033.1 N-hydroxyarylamine O-acetyltransferase [Methylomonas denitrificans]OAI02529.1 N-hydroxyarylamine O-acetyltransferase [Methylomonas methanica]TCV83153.1 N-hydroxyarylamine O-acetyltransferase [Methylomonas methanica]